ncbi:MAG TPA: hypothetical protein VFP66_16345 [Candidatus Limnocylindrales bacterium]|nr:hypothetical protein [Candidatus Limnocylindrales bacterium]
MSEYFEEDEPQGLPAGVYPATLVAIEDVTVEPFKDPKSGTDNGERWGFDWDVETDDGVVRLRQLTTRKLNDFPTNAWKVLSAFGYRGGRALRSDLIGKRCHARPQGERLEHVRRGQPGATDAEPARGHAADVAGCA